MEGQMLLFPLPVENLHAQFVWKMNSFFFFLVLDAVLWQSSEVPFCILLALEISPCVCLCPTLAASMPMGMYNHPFALSLGTVMVPLLRNGFVGNGL